MRSRIVAASSGAVLGGFATVDGSMLLMPVDPSDAVHVLAVIDAARTSAADNRVVEVVTPGTRPRPEEA